MFDALIIGGGPAGISAALTLRQRGKSVLIVSTAVQDSPLWRAELVDNYPGMPAMSGADMLNGMHSHAKASGVEFIQGRATSVVNMGESFGVAVGADFYESSSVIMAVGAALPKGFPGEKEYLGRGVSYCATCDGMLYRSKRVAVIAQSAEADEEAEFLRSIDCDVEYFDKARAKKFEIQGEERLKTLVADGTSYEVEAVFIFRSAVATDSLLPGLGTVTNMILHDEDMATNISGVFTCGDGAGTPYQVAKAVGEGNIAGISASKYIEKKKKKESI